MKELVRKGFNNDSLGITYDWEPTKYMIELYKFNLQVQRSILSFTLLCGVPPKGWGLLDSKYFFSDGRAYKFVKNNWETAQGISQYQTIFELLQEMIKGQMPIDALSIFLYSVERDKKISPLLIAQLVSEGLFIHPSTIYYNLLCMVITNFRIMFVDIIHSLLVNSVKFVAQNEGKILNDNEALLIRKHHTLKGLLNEILFSIQNTQDLPVAIDDVIEMLSQENMDPADLSMIISLRDQFSKIAESDDFEAESFESYFHLLKKHIKSSTPDYQREEALNIISDIFMATVMKKQISQEFINSLRNFKKEINV